MPTTTRPAPSPTYTAQDCRLEDLRAVLEARTDVTAYPHAQAVEQEVLLYRADHLRGALGLQPGAALARAVVRLHAAHRFRKRDAGERPALCGRRLAVSVHGP